MKEVKTTTVTENWKTIGASVGGRKTYQVSDQGRCKTINNVTGQVQITRGVRNATTDYLYFVDDYVHRHVAKAFLGYPDSPDRVVVSHIDTNKSNNAASNLEWVTVKENNNNPITQEKRRCNHATNKHKGQVIKAVRNGEVRYYKTGCWAAKCIGCSHVLVYNALNHKQSARRAKGWELSWVDMAEAK